MKKSFILLACSLCLVLNASLPELQNAPEEKILSLNSSAPVSVVMKRLSTLFDVKILVEVGPKYRDVTTNALRIFDEIFTIETDHMNFLKTERQFKTKRTVHCYEGETAEVLGKILPIIQGKILFWIDGREQSSIETIEKNLKSILASDQKNSVILISHIHSLFDNQSKNNPMLSFAEIVKIQMPNYVFYIAGDYAIAYPKSTGISPSPLVEACTESALFQKTNLAAEKVIAAEKIIVNAINKEEILFSDNTQNSPKRAIWEGLANLENRDYAKASLEFHSALAAGEDHWRVYWYIALAEFKRRNYQQAKKALAHVRLSAPDFEDGKQMERDLLDK